MISYRTDGPFVILTTNGKSNDREREMLFAALRSDPKVRAGASLIIDIREYEVQLTQAELQERVRAMLESLAGKVGIACAVLVGDTSLRIGLNVQLVAGNMNFRVGVFHGEAAARKWLAPGRWRLRTACRWFLTPVARTATLPSSTHIASSSFCDLRQRRRPPPSANRSKRSHLT